MAYTSVSDLVMQTITELSQVPGVVTQKYSAPIIQQYIQDAFLMEIERAWWPDHMQYLNSGIDSLTGKMTDDMTSGTLSTDGYGDVMYVWGPNDTRPLPSFSDSRNPQAVFTGTTSGPPQYIIPDAEDPKRPVRVFPFNSIGPLLLRVRLRPTPPFSLNTFIGIDPLLLKYDAAWMYCVNDGTIPAQVAKYELLCTRRRRDCISRFNNQSIQLDPRIIGNTSQWMESPR